MLYKKVQFLGDLRHLLSNQAKQVIYVAGKVTGLPAAEVQAKFKAAQTMLEANDWTVLNPCEFIQNDEQWQMAMRMAIPMLTMADVVYFLPCWKDSEGAKLEFELAKVLGLEVVFANGTQYPNHG